MATMLTRPDTNGFFFWDVVKNKEYVKNKEKNPKTVNELKDCIYDAFREIDAN